ncbi:MAG: gamma-glutamylcyclotransferase [Betaproteobacteria bacterium]|nr:gamma-glutamylcyclotransferase [Betaproteobacteria bacterium]
MGARICTFAYGSNMLTARLRERVPSAVAIGTGRLLGHVLKWHKRSRDGSGKCDAEATGRIEDVVWGVLFELNAAEKPALDRAEGLNNGYVERQVDIITDRGTVSAVAYIATATDPSLHPYHWYKAFVVAGAREHGLPQEYLQSLESAPSIPDPDSARAAQNERLLTAS